MLKLYNSLSRKIEEFKPIDQSQVGIYTCGPTVYQFAHIGNFRAYATADILLRTLKLNGSAVKFVMNITDVGHMTQDEEGGGDTGEDKIEKTAREQGKTAWEVAEFYTDIFLKDYKALSFTQPEILAKATDHIKEQINLIRDIEEKGYTYQTSDGIYFDTSLLPEYGKLSSLDQIKEGARVEANSEKRNPRDFALWKFSPNPSASSGGKRPASAEAPARQRPDTEGGEVRQRRQMEWKSPWGKGFPGWHIECSAMSMKYLGEQFDIHTGGVDHKEIHHPNEIAQSEAVTKKLLANYWVHTAFMQVAGQKMSKSLGNIYTLYDLEKKEYHPLALRYLYLQTHYRQEMNFTFPALDAASNALRKLLNEVAVWDEAGVESVAEFEERFFAAIHEDLNMPQALAVMWELVKSDYPSASKAKSIYLMDEILGFNLKDATLVVKREKGIIPGNIQQLVEERNRLRKEKRYNLSDQLRIKVEKMGYEIEDTKKGTKVRKK